MIVLLAKPSEWEHFHQLIDALAVPIRSTYTHRPQGWHVQILDLDFRAAAKSFYCDMRPLCLGYTEPITQILVFCVWKMRAPLGTYAYLFLTIFFALSSSKHLSLFLQEDTWKQEPRERDPDGRPRPQGHPAKSSIQSRASCSPTLLHSFHIFAYAYSRQYASNHSCTSRCSRWHCPHTAEFFNLDAAFSAASRAKDELVVLTIRMPRGDIECHSSVK